MLIEIAFAAAITVAGAPPQAAAPPAPQPPPDSPPLVRTIEIAFPRQGDTSLVEPLTYLYYIHTRPSRPSERVWSPYDRQSLLDDFDRLWATGFLDDLSIEERDVPWENGVIGKHITFNLEERQRVKIVDFEGSKAIDRAAIDETLKSGNAQIRLDTFIDAGTLRRAERILGEALRRKGFRSARVTHSVAELPGAPKLVHLTFHLDEGPKVRVKMLDIAGNTAMSDADIRRRMTGNKPRPWWRPPFLGDHGVYQEAAFADDADRIVQFYRDRGFIAADVGAPQIEDLGAAPDGRTRWVQLTVPVTEGRRYKVGEVAFEGNQVVKTPALQTVFKLRPNEYYRESDVRKGLEKAREIYGAAGYFEFTGYPDLVPRAGREIVDVTVRLEEGTQHFVSRVRFMGNTVTRDAVIRREIGVVEGGVFDTESLKASVRRLNQLGYFKPLDATQISVEKVSGSDNQVDVTFRVEEQNRNQVTFGAGLSQYQGFFGNLSYTTSNLIGRGESFTLSLQQGTRSNVYQIAFTEPYLFDRPISGSIDLYSRKYDFLTSANTVGYSEVREGVTLGAGWPLRRFSRAFVNYTYEAIEIAIADSVLQSPQAASASGTPYFNPYADPGLNIDSRVTPMFVHNTVDHPIMPHRGRRLTLSTAIAGRALRGTYNYVKPEAEAVFYLPTGRRTGFGVRAQGGWLRAYGAPTDLPYYLRYFLGGEQQIRGVNFRSVGPIDDQHRLLGGNKFALFNAEYYVDIAGPVRALVFHDAGQAFSESQPVDLRQLRTSTGIEVRVFMPVLNVPFRLIYAWNRYRDPFQPPTAFRFAIGTTF